MKTLLKSIALAGVFAQVLPAAAQEREPAVSHDVLGARMGMTPDEADAHFRAFGWEMVDEKAFVIELTGTEFVASRTYAVTDRSKNQDKIELYFSQPPTAPKLIRLLRTYKPYPLDFMIEPKLLPLEQMEASVTGKYGEPDFTKGAAAARVFRWSNDTDAARCASFTNGHFRIVPTSGRAPVPDCHGEHLEVRLQFSVQNIGPVLGQANFELVDVDEYRVDFTRYRAHLADIQTQKQREQTAGAEAPPL